MPWNSQGGGGPWQGGGGGPGPMGRPPGGGGQQPPDLEELLRRSQERVRSLFPGGGGVGIGRKGLRPGRRWSCWVCGCASGIYRCSRTSRAW